MNRICTALAVAALATLPARAVNVMPGVWNDDFGASLEYAQAQGLPLVVVWGNTSCDYCNKLAAAIESETVAKWIAGRKIMLVHKHVEKSLMKEADYLTAKAWIKNINSKLSAYPFVGMWCKNAEGAEKAVAFTGRTGKMPSVEPAGDLAGQFKASLEAFLDEAATSSGGGTQAEGTAYFVAGDSEYDRLESEPSTKSVNVPLARKGSGRETSTLEVLHPGATRTVSRQVSWSAGESAKMVAVSMPSYRPAGNKTTLTLKDASGATMGISHITHVATKATSISNPKFVGEKFDYGEWTMDYAAAKKKDGFVLAVFSGVLWCPYCYGIEHSLFASPKFTAWARLNKVSLVLFDQSMASDPATAEGSGKARLLTYDAGDSYSLGTKASGAGYLSRKGISAVEARKVIDETTKRTVQWRAPGSTAARLGNPSILLVANDEVVARMSPTRDADRYYDPDANIALLDAMIAGAGGGSGGGGDATANKYLAKAQKTCIALTEDGALAGTVEISSAKNGRVNAKWTGLDGKRISFSGKWAAVDAQSGTALAVLEKKGSSIELSLSADGTVAAVFDGAQGAASLAGDIAAFDGKYTITMPVADTGAEYPCRGTGWLTATLKNGKATFKGALPDGTAVSLTTRYGVDPDDTEYALVPILKRTAKDTLAAVLRVRSGGAELYADEQQLRIIRAAEGAAQLWIRHATGDAFETAFDVYGGWFATGKTVAQWLALYGLAEAAPAIDGVETAGKYSYSKTTGKINGTLKNVTLADGTFVASGKFAGVLLPGWVDCGCGEEEYPGQYIERPFASGSFRYTVKEGTKKITVSVPFDLIAK